MTKDELRAAAEDIVNGHTFYVEARVGSNNYRNRGGNNTPCRAVWNAGRSNEPADDVIRSFANAYLAEHRADDEFPLEWDWLSKVATMEQDQGYWDVPPSGDVWWEIGPISFGADSWQYDQDEPMETVAIDWQVDGEELPRMLVPATRGQLRQLCRLLGHELKEPG